MTYSVKPSGSRFRRSAAGILLSGAGTISIDQTMIRSRRQLASGSLRSDWKAVGRDIAGAIRNVNREFESVR
jgi:hypothetical protein